MSGQRNSRLVALGVALAIGLAAAYVNNGYGHRVPTQADGKAHRGVSERIELLLPPDLWPRQ